MKAVDDATCTRVERNLLLRQLREVESVAQKLRSQLGLVQREQFVNVLPNLITADGITRLRTDQIDRLYEKGRINADERAAALKIRLVWEAMGRGLFPSCGGEMRGTQSRGTFRHPLERMTDKELWVWFREYKPWANGPAAKVAIDKGVSFRISFLQICYSVVVDNHGPSQLEASWGLSRGNGVVTAAVKQGLSFWRHIEFDSEISLRDVQRETVEASRARVEEAKPRARAS